MSKLAVTFLSLIIFCIFASCISFEVERPAIAVAFMLTGCAFILVGCSTCINYNRLGK